MSGRISRRGGRWETTTPFRLIELQEAAAAAKFNVSQVKTDTPTLILNDIVYTYGPLKKGYIKRIHYRINPANVETYTLRIWGAALAGDYESNAWLLYESPAAQVGDTDYDRAELDIPFMLGAANVIWYSLEWTGATGNVQGFIEVSGESVS